MPPIRRLCVYAGSNPGAHPGYAAAAERLAALMAERGIGLVYGGGDVGLMGVLADSVLARGGEAIGVIPQALMDREIGHRGLTELRVVGSMHERKALMAELSDGFIAMPGGIGTMEEFFEVLSWAQLGLHEKPCGLLNVSGYYDSLIRFLDHAMLQDFIKPKHRELMIVEGQPAKLLDRFEDFLREHPAKRFDSRRT